MCTGHRSVPRVRFGGIREYEAGVCPPGQAAENPTHLEVPGGLIVTGEHRPGFYLDSEGVWQKERRKGGDRRRKSLGFHHHERRIMGRRRNDILEGDREARAQIEEAIEDFVSEHDGNTAL